MSFSSVLSPKIRIPEAIVDHINVELPDGTPINVHIARFLKSRVKPRLVVFDKQIELLKWCRQHHINNAINGGFTMHHQEEALGEIWTAGEKHKSVPFSYPWHTERGSIHITKSGHIKIAPRYYLPSQPDGDLLQTTPLLVHKGKSLIIPGVDPEGISASSDQFDDDWTQGQHYPRAAIGANDDFIFCVVADGYKKGREQGINTGLTLGDMANIMIELGATEALNLDGGSSASLVVDGKLINRVQGHITVNYKHYPEGRPLPNAIIFEPLREKIPLVNKMRRTT